MAASWVRLYGDNCAARGIILLASGFVCASTAAIAIMIGFVSHDAAGVTYRRLFLTHRVEWSEMSIVHYDGAIAGLRLNLKNGKKSRSLITEHETARQATGIGDAKSFGALQLDAELAAGGVIGIAIVSQEE
jgi:hypothetical protein